MTPMFDSFAGRETSRRAWSRSAKGLGTALALALLATLSIYGFRSRKTSKPPPQVYTATTLPGMALDVPGIVLHEGSYAKGRIHGATAGSVRPNRFELAWHPGGAADEATVRAVASEMVAKSWPHTTPAMTTRTLEIGGHPGIRLLAQGRDETMVIALATCGDRGVSLFVQGDGAAEIADHMIASFTCTPDPAQDVFASEVAFADSPSWHLRPHTQIVDGPGDLDVRYIAFDPEGAGGVADQVQRYVPDSYQLITPPSSNGDKVMWIGTRVVDNKPLPIAVLAWPCTGGERIAMAVVESASSHPLDEGIAFAATGRCASPTASN